MPFQDMTDRELMIKLYARVDNLCEDVQELKEALKNRPCPSTMCNDHEGRLTTVESYLKVLGVTVGTLATAVISFAIERIWGS